MVAESLAAPADRKASGLASLHVRVAGNGVTCLVNGDRPRLLRDVLDVYRHARLDRRHRLDDLLPAEAWLAFVVGVGQAIEQTCSIIAGEYPFVMRAISSRRLGESSSGSCETLLR